mgnify:CR=1 FL=1
MTMNGAVLPVLAMYVVTAEEQVRINLDNVISQFPYPELSYLVSLCRESVWIRWLVRYRMTY